MSTSIFHIRMKEELLNAIKDQAKNEKRTVAEIIRQLLVSYLKQENKFKLQVVEEKLNGRNKNL